MSPVAPGTVIPKIGDPIAKIQTPAVLVDTIQMDDNIERFTSFAMKEGVNLRSHVKTHKSPAIAQLQHRRSGGGGIVCQTLGEAEIMAKHGLSDIYLSHNVVGPQKLDRLVRLSAALDHFATTVDGRGNIEPLQNHAAKHGENINCILEIDLGLCRTGVSPGRKVLDTAQSIMNSPNLHFTGVMAFEGHINGIATDIVEYERLCEESMDELADEVQRLQNHGINVDEVKVGSTGTSRYSGRHPVVTEVNPGMYPFNDVNVVSWGGPIEPEQCALTVLATVVSKPTPTRAIVDAGSKTMSFDVDVMPIVREEGVNYVDYSEEHGHLEVTDLGQSIAVGDRLEFIVPHVCTTVNLHDHLIGISGGVVDAVWPVEARGALQ